MRRRRPTPFERDLRDLHGDDDWDMVEVQPTKRRPSTRPSAFEPHYTSMPHGFRREAARWRQSDFYGRAYMVFIYTVAVLAGIFPGTILFAVLQTFTEAAR